ncbi:MAG TPA: tetratricopeptide repeat protein [Candidatus Deferrimicrobium sp.]|nr:tetratricopeptide repeat protein [Candidatus Deferrimicrobium sp.]
MRNAVIVAACLSIITASVPRAGEVDYSETFARANRLYEQKDYTAAIEGYSEIQQAGVESASLYFNLGNAYFKAGDLGRAILYYHKARRLDPSDGDLLTNLEFAGQFSSVQMEGVQLNPIHSFFVSLVDPYRIDVLAWVSSLCFVLFVGLLTVRLGLKITHFGIRFATMLALVMLTVSAGLTTFKYRHEFLTRRGVIIAEEAPVNTGPSEQSGVELQGAPGLVVEILSETSDYYSVLFENKRRGWIKKDLIAEI